MTTASLVTVAPKTGRTISCRPVGGDSKSFRVTITDGVAKDYILTPLGGLRYTMDRLGTATEPSESYQVHTGLGICDCKAGQYRRVECRHVAGVRALASAGHLAPVPVVRMSETDYCPL